MHSAYWQRWQVLLTTMMQLHDVVRVIAEACVCLHNLMSRRYPALQNVQLDMEDDQHYLVPGLWRTNANMHKVQKVVGPNRDMTVAELTRVPEVILQQPSRICAKNVHDNRTVKLHKFWILTLLLIVNGFTVFVWLFIVLLFIVLHCV